MKRLNFLVDDEQAGLIQQIADQTGQTTSEVLRALLPSQQWMGIALEYSMLRKLLSVEPGAGPARALEWLKSEALLAIMREGDRPVDALFLSQLDTPEDRVQFFFRWCKAMNPALVAKGGHWRLEKIPAGGKFERMKCTGWALLGSDQTIDADGITTRTELFEP